MAILKREGADKVDEVTRLFREQALEWDGSLLSPGCAVWTTAALDDLHEWSSESTRNFPAFGSPFGTNVIDFCG